MKKLRRALSFSSLSGKEKDGSNAQTPQNMTPTRRPLPRPETPPPPSVEEASRALEEALEETSGIVFSSSQSSSKPREPLRKLEHNLISSDNSHKYITEQSLLEVSDETITKENQTSPNNDQKFWLSDPRRGDGTIQEDNSQELAILSLSPKIGPTQRKENLSSSTQKLPQLSVKVFGPPSARKTPLGSVQSLSCSSRVESSQLLNHSSKGGNSTSPNSFNSQRNFPAEDFAYAEFSITRDSQMSSSGLDRPHSVSARIPETNLRREHSRLSLAANFHSSQKRADELRETIRPLRFEQPGSVGREELIGRGWLFDDIAARIASVRTVAIVGDAGFGKTTIIDELVKYSTGRKIHSPRSPKQWSALGMGGYARSGTGSAKMSSSMSLHQLNLSVNSASSHFQSQRNLNLNLNEQFEEPSVAKLAAQVVAYHFCQSDNSATCLVPEFVRSIAAHLVQSPHLRAYQEYVKKNSQIQEYLSPQNCIKDSHSAFVDGICYPLVQLTRDGLIPRSPLLILIDSLDSAELHRPDFGPTIPIFLSKLVGQLPPQFKLVLTVRTQMRHLVDVMPTSIISIDNIETNANLLNDIVQYCSSRLQKAPFICSEVIVNGSQDRIAAQKLLLQRLVERSRGNFLYMKLVLDLIEARRLTLRSSTFSVLPNDLNELFAMLSNLQFPTNASFERAKPILAICLATLYPLRDEHIYQAIQAGYVDSQVGSAEFRQRMSSVGSLLSRRTDGRRVFLHPAYREWLCLTDPEANRFTIDPRDGHALLALLLSRQGKPHHFSATIELGHHILKSHIFRGSRSKTGYSSSVQNVLWLMSSNVDIAGGLLAPRNLFYPNLRVTKLLLSAGAPVNSKTTALQNAPPLVVAAATGCLPFVKLLLEYNADKNASNDLGRTATSFAAENGHVAILEQLHLAGADIYQVDQDGLSPVVHAARVARTECIDFLLSRDWAPYAKQVTKKEVCQQVLVHSAGANNFEVVDFMLNYPSANCRAEINVCDQITGETALTMASIEGNIEMVEHLIASYSADPNRRNEQGLTPLGVAAKADQLECVDFLVSSGAQVDVKLADEKNALIIAAAHGSLRCCQRLVELGVNLEATDREGMTALSAACFKGHREVAQFLLDRGARISHRDIVGRNPMHLAALGGDKNTVSLLLSRNCDQFEYDSSNMRPLERAISSRSGEVALLLLRSGSRPEAATWALAADRVELLFLLLHKTLEDANIKYKVENIAGAWELYKLGLARFSAELLNSGLENTAELKASLLLGASRCARRQGNQLEAEEKASSALNLKPRWFQAFYARSRARAEMGKVDESFQDICEAERLEPSNKVIRRYRVRLQQEAERSGIHLVPQRLHNAMNLNNSRNPNFGSQESIGGLSIASGATVREPPVPPPRIKSNPTGYQVQPGPARPRAMPRTNPFYSFVSSEAKKVDLSYLSMGAKKQLTSNSSKPPAEEALQQVPKQTDF
ncbi:Oidioi.mRNA.OKI2018_I69.XSR.g16978.t1.cds [Oikopleura dioica]|uniref:Oidioi.mRNA.OKI2018_I69.XSR.g16978.t1.cds n=1 Tax=Oikopleura dioica TaxID=34765 RepID=A0ABN7SLL7_OIKDI|nr:Oidioi.mRNA.OKI2018_I69.XSR.g16978.t1.cds [Oikopleura dioica]